MMERVAWMVPFARRVRTIRMCSLDARGLGPIQATLFESASYTTAALLNGLFEHPGLYPLAIPGLTASEITACPPSLPPTASHHVLS
jgi:hypothetical protein